MPVWPAAGKDGCLARSSSLPGCAFVQILFIWHFMMAACAFLQQAAMPAFYDVGISQASSEGNVSLKGRRYIP